MRYWNPTTNACYIQMQVDRMEDEAKAQLVEIEEDCWMELIRQNAEEGKLIQNDPETNLPVAVDPPEPTEEELLQMEKEELEDYLESTNTATIIYLQQLMTPMTLPAGVGSFQSMSAEEYAQLNQKRLEAAARIKEIDALLEEAQSGE